MGNDKGTAVEQEPTITISEPTPMITRNGPVTFTVTYDQANANSLAEIALEPENIALNRTGTATGTISASGRINLAGMDSLVRALAVDSSGNVYAGGQFKTAGGISANGVAKWDGVAWSKLGTGVDLQVYAIAVDSTRGVLYVAGQFNTAGGVEANNVARWDGNAWSAMGAGVDYVVYALAVDASGNLYAGGSFKTAGGKAVWYIAKWNGEDWSPLGTGVNFPVKGSGPVYALAVDTSGNLYAGGTFTTAGGVPTNRIAKWDGVTWSALGTGMEEHDASQPSVHAITVDVFGNVYAGGSFKTAGGVLVNGIAKWDGAAWSALGNGMAHVNSLSVDSFGNVYAAGHFAPMVGTATGRICKWKGTVWSPLEPAKPFGGNVFTVDARGNVYAVGSFSRVGGVVAHCVAKWNGTAWLAMTNTTGTGTVTLSSITGKGTLGIEICPGSATDVTGNIVGSSVLGNIFAVDDTLPMSGISTGSEITTVHTLTESDKRFLVALSFPGEYRYYVERVANLLSSELGSHRVLYDRFCEAEFARPNLDIYLQTLYHQESELVVVFLCAEYEEKEWTGLEWRAIRDRIKSKQDESVMLIRMDDSPISGLYSTDGYVDAKGRNPEDIFLLILERLNQSIRDRGK